MLTYKLIDKISYINHKYYHFNVLFYQLKRTFKS